jgi:membrane-associated protease RseP (regulator of RpoE activity)
MKTTLTPQSVYRNNATNPGGVRTPRPTVVIMTLSALMAFTPWAMAKMSKAILSDADGVIVGGSPSVQVLKVEAVDSTAGKSTPKEVAWLGISTDEACDVLASQLGLKAGEGLVVIYVQPNSPAAKAGLQKYDVLVEMGDQMLVHPGQLRKLVRLQKEGDSIKLEFYRAGKRQSVTATLGKTMEHTDASDEISRKIPFQISDAQTGESLHGHMKGIQSAVTHAGYNRGSANVDLQRSMEEARKALHDALTRNGNLTWVVGPGVTNLESLNVGKGYREEKW